MRKLGFVALLLAPSVHAELTDVAGNGFTSVHTRTIAAPPSAAWEAATSGIDRWWNPEHTLSGDASRLRLEPKPLGCFCEDFGEDAGLVHLMVTASAPPGLLRMTGGLGPLGVMGVEGNMTWEFEAVDGGTRIRFVYAVGGYAAEGLDKLAAPVDAVLGEALARLADYLEAS